MHNVSLIDVGTLSYLSCCAHKLDQWTFSAFTLASSLSVWPAVFLYLWSCASNTTSQSKTFHVYYYVILDTIEPCLASVIVQHFTEESKHSWQLLSNRHCNGCLWYRLLYNIQLMHLVILTYIYSIVNWGLSNFSPTRGFDFPCWKIVKFIF